MVVSTDVAVLASGQVESFLQRVEVLVPSTCASTSDDAAARLGRDRVPAPRVVITGGSLLGGDEVRLAAGTGFEARLRGHDAICAPTA